MRQVLRLEQGSPEWHAHRNTPGIVNGSEIYAKMGIPGYTTRAKLLQRDATGITEEVDTHLQRRFDKGHRQEALARPLAEDIIGDDLSALVMTDTIEGLLFSVSLDGITQGYDITFEHKSLNQELAAALDAGIIPDQYHPQCEAGLMVAGAKRCLFMASKWEEAPGSDEEPGKVYGFAANENGLIVRYRLIEEKHCWYEPNLELRPRMIAAEKQYAIDRANYQHVEVAERPAPAVTIELPALFVHAKGEITDSNMKAYGEALALRLAEVRAIQLVTDQDFSNAKQSAAMLREQCAKMKLTKEAMLSQTVTIGEAARMMDAWSEDMRVTALKLEKDVEREDAAKKAAIVSGARNAFEDHIKALNVRLGGQYMPATRPNFAEAIKCKRSYTSMTDAVDAMLSNANVDSDMMADRIELNRKSLFVPDLVKQDSAMVGMSYEHLFPDFAAVCTKAPDDFAALLGSRIAAEEKRLDEAKKAEEARIAAAVEAERIRKEEADKLAQQAANDQRGKANAGITTPACEQTTAAPDAGIMPVELIAGNAASAASTPPIQDQFASAGKMIDAPSMLTEFLALQPLNMAEKKAWRAVIEKWEPYRIKVEAARALKAAA